MAFKKKLLDNIDCGGCIILEKKMLAATEWQWGGGVKEAMVRHRLGFKQLVGREGQERGARLPGPCRGSGGGQEKKLEQHDGQRPLSGWQEGLEINWGLVGVWGTAGAPRLVSNLPVRGSFNTAAKPGRVHRSSDGISSARKFSKSLMNGCFRKPKVKCWNSFFTN